MCIKTILYTYIQAMGTIASLLCPETAIISQGEGGQ